MDQPEDSMDSSYRSDDSMDDNSDESDVSMNEPPASPNPNSFRLMDLPPELREHIYHYVFLGPANTYTRKLGKFKLPAITRSSPQLRAETLPLFFAECDFEILVGANLLELVKYGGTLGIKSSVEFDLKKLGAAAAFKRVRFVLCETDDVRRLRNGSPSDAFRESHICGTLSIREHRGFTSTFAPGGGYHGASRPKMRAQDHGFESQDVNQAVQCMVQHAREIAGRRGFIGFTIRDLDVIVKRLRFG
ncbi:hypothetical protein LTR08_006180 [Meristemomyces frigidus]|nr:hypothetical protein LTR08_006180 [Meristemomyces frigidus]